MLLRLFSTKPEVRVVIKKINGNSTPDGFSICNVF